VGRERAKKKRKNTKPIRPSPDEANRIGDGRNPVRRKKNLRTLEGEGVKNNWAMS